MGKEERIPKADRQCTLLVCNVIEDEYHVLIICQRYVNERGGRLPEHLITNPCTWSFYKLLQCKDVHVQTQLVWVYSVNIWTTTCDKLRVTQSNVYILRLRYIWMILRLYLNVHCTIVCVCGCVVERERERERERETMYICHYLFDVLLIFGEGLQ